MEKKRILITVLIITFILITIANFYMIFQFLNTFNALTGKSLYHGGIRFLISEIIDFEIIHPENNSLHEFNYTDDEVVLVNDIPRAHIWLNVSTQDNIENWHFSLYSFDYDTDYYDWEGFTPNQTIDIKRGMNRLTVHATTALGTSLSKSIILNVSIIGSAPIINITNASTIYACENQAFNYPFNITYLDDELDLLELEMTPGFPFYLSELKRVSPGLFNSSINSLASFLTKNRVNTYQRKITATVVSGVSPSDEKYVYIDVLEVNRIPQADEIGIIMVWNQGDKNTSFVRLWNVTDIEDDNSLDGNLHFNLSYANETEFNLFSINSTGHMNFTANENTSLKEYYLKACVTDNPLDSPHENLMLHCGVDGGANTICENFYFIVTDENRPPEIIEYYPNNNSFEIRGETSFTVNTTAYDPDPYPLFYEWTLNNNNLKTQLFNFSQDYNYTDNLTFAFPCGVGGNQILKVSVNDGEYSTSHNWTINVDRVPCPSPPSESGGGGGAASPMWCYEEWVCEHWNQCQHVQDLFNQAKLTLKDYNHYLDQCRQYGYDDKNCGFQDRDCKDINNCTNLEYMTPYPEPRLCFYTPNPSCYDRIRNCHSGSCEQGIDCGGPCKPCPTCFDGIQNQGEQGIDCAGPCPFPCELEEPFKLNHIVITFLIIIISLILFIILFGYKIISIIFGWNKGPLTPKDKSPFYTETRKRERIKSFLDNLKRGDKNEGKKEG